MKNLDKQIKSLMAIVLLSGFLFSPVLLQSQDDLACPHEVILYDTFGDGWNDNTISVFVDGVLVLDTLTLTSGYGPESVYFSAETGQEITTVFNSSNSWSYECWYEIADINGYIIASDGLNDSVPTGIQSGQCFADCTDFTGLSENNTVVSVKVFPNPTNKLINIESEQEITHLNLLDDIGRILQSIELQMESSYTIDVSGYKPGVYILRIDTEQGRAVRKVVVTE